MDDLEYLENASKLVDKGGTSAFHRPGWTFANKGLSDANQQLTIWQRMNREANTSYSRLYAHVHTDFNLPDKSGRLLRDAFRHAREAPETPPLNDIKDLLRWYLEKRARHDERSRALVDDYVTHMHALVKQSRIVVGGNSVAGNSRISNDSHEHMPSTTLPILPAYQIAPSTGYIPKQGSESASELENQFQSMLVTIGNAQTHLTALTEHLTTNAREYISKEAYDTLLRQWNVAQKEQHDRDYQTAMDLIQIVTDIHSQYGVGSGETAAMVTGGELNFERAVDAMTSRLESLLASRYAITRMPVETGREFDPQIMKVEKADSMPTADVRLIGRVAHVVIDGYWRLASDGKATIYQRASVIRYGGWEKQRK